MPRQGHGQQDKQEREPPHPSHKQGAIEQRNPHQRYRDDFHPQRYGLMFEKVADIGTQPLVIQKPVIEPWRTAQPQGCRQQQKRGGRQQRQEDTGYPQAERESA